ncbi:starch-binding protein [Ruminococcus sp.]|uniref:starch-binding protein n=1 Tax=Ruminococcus sp. TaxID=41978 RepID=UPI0038691199
MSRNSKKKKSTSKYRDFKVSPLIAVTALIEVVVLVVVSSFAWFYLSENKEVNIGTVSVDADSGLDIDFKYAKEDDYINIWNYVDKEFKFEPVTSLDGRNVYVPTSGTFDNTNTSDMVFREGTVNDINSKYINIDFELTNTTDYDMKVFLNNNSYFNVKNKGTDEKDESRALRLAFYPNDASTGKVTSQLIGTSSDYSGQEDTGSSTNKKTVYFDNTTWTNGQASKTWDKVYAYIWNSSNKEYAAWPGVEMSQISGPIYSWSFNDDGSNYNKIIFNSGVGNQTGNLTLTNGNIYTASGSSSTFTPNTVYFVKPDSWEHVYVHAWRGTDSSPQYYTTWPTSGDVSGLDEMKYVGSGIYSYTYSGEVTRMLFTNGTYAGTNQTENFTPVNDKIYYISSTASSGKYNTSPYSKNYSTPITNNTIYFYNSLGWDIPYVNATIGTTTISLPMTTLNGNVYYINLPEVYSNIYFRNKANTYFTYAINGTGSANTDGLKLQAGYVYRPLNDKDGSGNYKMNAFKYADYTSENGYAVISPGVSAGFQRTYTPVVKINNDTGAAAEVIPAFSNSIDNYIFGNKAGDNGTSQTVFEIGAKHMISLSMVIWLEGTDPACTAEAYAGNNIEMRLEFASSYYDTDQGKQINVNTYGSDTYKYKFYDKTREVWTSDRKATESGITVAPVMQLYDNTVKRGYLMSPESYVTVDGKQKVSCWSVDAPQNIALWGHDIIFRRVNPYDEDEVWNYWHAGRVAGAENDPVYTDRKTPATSNQTVYSVATAGTTDTISFTAFADGSPTEDMLSANGNTTTEINLANVPADSCGGLWGNHQVRSLTVVDGLPGHTLQNDGAIMTMTYNYRYSGGGKNRNVRIEYKASGPSNTIFYYFVIPNVAYTATDPVNTGTGLNVRFKRYTGFDSGYAINSELNDELKFATIDGSVSAIDAGKPKGDYYEINRERDLKNASGNRILGNANNYWGSDLLYVETTATTSDYCFSGDDKGTGKNRLLQVHYRMSSNTGRAKYSYLYAVDDATIKGSAVTAFVSVVPNDYRYNQYRVECCDWDDVTNDNKKFFTDYITFKADLTESIAATSGDDGSATSFNRNYMNNLNICKLDWFRDIYIYFQTNNAALDNRNGGNGGLPAMYLYKGSTHYNWPGEQMVWNADVGNGIKKYVSKTDFNVINYNTVIFNNNVQSGATQTGELTLDLCSRGNVYECHTAGGTPTCVSYNNDANNVIEANTWATNNSHYAPKQ